MKIGKKVSKKAWGEIDKSALGKALAEAYTAGKASKAVIRDVYAFVPEDAFGKGEDGKATFAYSKAWGPHHELQGESVVLNREGLGAAAAALAGARSEPSLDDAAKTAAKRHLRRHYRAIKEDPPEGLAESLAEPVQKLDRGRPLEELVKGSFDYKVYQIRLAFDAQFRALREMEDFWLYIEETFADYVVVSVRGLPADEYYMVRFEEQGDEYVFAPYDQWELVELTYQPVGDSSSQGDEKSESVVGEKRKRFTEVGVGHVEMVEAAGEDGRRRIKAVGITADVINGNSRRYPGRVLRAAVEELKSHLHESAGQGRFLLPGVLGEAEHPSMKGGRPSLLETIVKWEAVNFDGQNVLLEGAILPTSKGKDLLAIMEGGVMPGVSQRGYGESTIVDDGGRRVEVVEKLHITGYDLVLEPADPEAGVTILESQQEVEMDPEVLKQFITDNPQLFESLIGGQVATQVAAMGADQLKKLEESLRATLGIGPEADLAKALTEAVDAKKQLDESKRAQAVETAITEATKGLPYGELNEAFVAAVKGAKPATAEAVKPLVEAKRAEYDAIVAKAKLGAMGFRHDGVQVLGPVIERDTDHPEFARGAFEFSESLITRGYVQPRDLRKPHTVNERVAARIMSRFDKLYQMQLGRESRLMQEAEASTDLNLPYSVSRAILAAVWPQLISTSIFDVDMTDQAPSRVYYEAYEGESGSSADITNEDTTMTALDTWYDLAHKMLQPGTLTVVNHSDGDAAMTEGTDYVIDYINGKAKALTGGGFTAGHTLRASYTYDVVREGESQAIQRGKMTLSYATLEIAANRLALQITNEAVVFARSQIGWDATTRTLASLVNQLRRKIDKNLMYNALNASLSVASNSGGTWNHSTAAIIDFISYIGVSKVKVAARFYNPDWVLASATNSDRIGNWDGFTAAGQRPDSDLNANGYVGRIKGLPVFQSTEFSDRYALVGNREIVMYRIFQPMTLKGPYPSYSSTNLVAADQWYAEQYDGAVTPVANKASHVVVT